VTNSNGGTIAYSKRACYALGVQRAHTARMWPAGLTGLRWAEMQDGLLVAVGGAVALLRMD
jgi:hypothetical protein